MVLFCSCENFLKAQDTRNEIISAIDYANAKSYLIKVEAAKGSGTIVKPVGGEISKKVTDSFNIVFEPAKDYQFVRWEAKSEKLPEGANIKDYIKIEEPGSLETTVTFTKELSDIIIYANCPRIPYADVWIDGSNGKLSPAKGTHTVNQNESNYISFEADGDFAFIKWQIYDSTTGNELQNGLYLEIEDPSAQDTNFKLVNVPADQAVSLAIKPLVLERPQVISATPGYDSKGAYRDARIQVMFDSDIDPASIYYTTDEYKALKDELGLEENDFLKIDLGTTAQPDIKYYGYTKNNNTVFKNIQIVNNKTYANLLSYYEKPRFEGSRKLIISPKKNNLPPGGTTFLVTLDKNFSYLTENDKPVNMREAKKWIYFLNSQTDQNPPSVSEVEILDANDNPLSTTPGTYSFLNKEKKLKFRVAVTDFDSGPASYFDMILTNISSGAEKTIPIYYEEVQEGYANCGNVFDEEAIADPTLQTYYEYALTEFPPDDGDYKFYLKFYDNSVRDGEEYKDPSHPDQTLYYYISLDTTAPLVKTRTIDTCDDSEDSSKTGITFTYLCEDDDLVTAKLYYRPAIATTAENWDNWSTVTPDDLEVATTEKTKTVTGLDYGQTYEIKVDFIDRANNITSYLFKKRTLPEKYSTTLEQYKTTYDVKEDARCIKINTPHFAHGADETILLYKTNNDSDFTSVTYNAAQGNTFYVRDMKYARTYDVKLVSKNSESVTEDCYENKGYSKVNEFETQILSSYDTKPKRISTFNIEQGTPNPSTGKLPVTIKYSLSDSYVGGVQYSYAKYDSEDFTTDTQAFTTTSGTITIPELSLDTNSHYRLILKTYYKTTSNLCDEANKKEIDFWTKETSSVAPVKTVKVAAKTKNTATIKWERDTTDDIENYKLEWKKGSTKVGEATAPKTQNTFMLTGLTDSTTSYTVNIYCCTSDGNISDAKSCSVQTKQSDFYFIIGNMRDTQSNKAINFSFQNRGNSTDGNNTILKYGTAYNILNQKWTGTISNSSAGFNNLTADQTYYFRFFDNNGTADDESDDIPASILYAIRPAYERESKWYNLTSFSYTIDNSKTKNVTLNWTWNTNGCPSSTNNLYIHYKATDSSQWNCVQAAKNDKSCQMQLQKGKDYEIRFSGLDTYNSSNYYASGFVSVPSALETNIPSCTETTANTVTLTWPSSNYPNCDWYNVYDVTSGSAVLVADRIQKPASSNENISVTITGLKQNTTYKFNYCPHRVGTNEQSDVSSCRTVTTARATEKPPRVSDLNYDYTAIGTTSSVITWKSPGTEYDTFYVQYKLKSETAREWSSVSGKIITGKRCELTGLTSGSEYLVRVRTMVTNPSGGYSWSDPEYKSIYTMPNTCPCEATAITNSSITINWSYPEGNYSKIIISYKKGQGTGNFLKQIKFTDTEKPNTLTLENLEPDTEYLFGITVYASGDEDLRFSNYEPEKKFRTAK